MEIDTLKLVFDVKHLMASIKAQRSRIFDFNQASHGPLTKSKFVKRLDDGLNELGKFISKLEENFINESNYLISWSDLYQLIVIQINVIKACDGITGFLNNIVDGYSDASKGKIIASVNEVQQIAGIIQNELYAFLNNQQVEFKDLAEIFDKNSDQNNKNNSTSERIDELGREELLEILASYKQELNSHLISEKNRATAYVDSQKNVMESLFGDLKNLSAIAAGKRLGGVFESNANKEEIYANRFRTYAIILMVAVGFLLVANLYLFEKQVFTATDAYLRIAIGLFFSLVVAYLARQSAVHRSQQYMYLQKALDVTSISPYIADLPDGPRHEVKKMIAERIFVPPSQSASDGNAFITPEIFAKFLEKVDFSKKG